MCMSYRSAAAAAAGTLHVCRIEQILGIPHETAQQTQDVAPMLGS